MTSPVRQIRGISRLMVETLGAVARGRWRGALGYMLDIGNRSLFFVLVTLGFLGAIFIFQAGLQGQRIIGDNSLTGAASLPLLMRQLGPTLCGLMVATRVGTGIAARIGSMVVTEQVDALRMSNASPVDTLIAPRFVASVCMMPALTILGVLSAWAAGLLVAASVYQVNPSTYASLDYVKAKDLVEGLIKAVVFGMVIPVISGHAGLSARGGSEGVGQATTQAVVNGSLAVIMLDFVIGGLVFVVVQAMKAAGVSG